MAKKPQSNDFTEQRQQRFEREGMPYPGTAKPSEAINGGANGCEDFRMPHARLENFLYSSNSTGVKAEE